MERKMRNNRS
jgi:hypothetical protein